jgi:hypothetical protein
MDDGDTMTDKPLTLEEIDGAWMIAQNHRLAGEGYTRGIRTELLLRICAAARAALSKGERSMTPDSPLFNLAAVEQLLERAIREERERHKRIMARSAALQSKQGE